MLVDPGTRPGSLLPKGTPGLTLMPLGGREERINLLKAMVPRLFPRVWKGRKINVRVGRLRLRLAGDSWNSDGKSIWRGPLGLSRRFDHLRVDTLGGMGVLGGYLPRRGRSPKIIDIG
jgi:hypothetical protein